MLHVPLEIFFCIRLSYPLQIITELTYRTGSSHDSYDSMKLQPVPVSICALFSMFKTGLT